MVAVSIDEIDALNSMVEKLRVITFLQKLIINEFIDDDSTLKGLELNMKSYL